MSDGSIRVLVADDHPLYRSALASVVEDDPDLELVGSARDGVEVLTLIGTLVPDVVTLDVRMPGLSGRQVVEQVIAAGLGVRVLLISAQIEDYGIYEALQAGVAGYLTKGSDADTIAASIKSVADGGVVLSPDAQTAVAIGIRARGSVLSPREQAVLVLAAEGLTNPEIAGCLHLSRETVKAHLSSIYRKLGVPDRTAAVTEAIRMGLIVVRERAPVGQ